MSRNSRLVISNHKSLSLAHTIPFPMATPPHLLSNPSIAVAGLDPDYKYLAVLIPGQEPHPGHICRVGRTIRTLEVGDVHIIQYCGFDSASHLFKIQPHAFWILDETIGRPREVFAEYLVSRPATADLPWYHRLRYFLLHQYRMSSVVPMTSLAYHRGFYPILPGSDSAVLSSLGVPSQNSILPSDQDSTVKSTFSE